MKIAKLLVNAGCNVFANLPSPLFNIAKSIICEVLNLKQNCAETEISQALSNASPQQIIKLKQAEQNFKLQQQFFELNKAKQKHEYHTNLRKLALSYNDITPNILALAITFGFFALLIFILLVDTNSSTLINVMTGSLGTSFIAIINYYFGSSLSSTKKNLLLSEQIKLSGKN
jgi:hypothetical protein